MRNQSTAAKRTVKRGIAGDMAQSTAFVRAMIDDHSRLAYAEIHNDEKAATAIGVLQRATSCLEARGVTVERVLFVNESAYRLHAWREA